MQQDSWSVACANAAAGAATAEGRAVLEAALRTVAYRSDQHRAAGRSMKPADQRMWHFQLMSYDEQCAAIRRLASSGMGHYTIAAATGLSVEMVRKILGRQGVQ
jgi:hypothetical protein